MCLPVMAFVGGVIQGTGLVLHGSLSVGILRAGCEGYPWGYARGHAYEHIPRDTYIYIYLYKHAFTHAYILYMHLCVVHYTYMYNIIHGVLCIVASCCVTCAQRRREREDQAGGLCLSMSVCRWNGTSMFVVTERCTDSGLR